MRPPHRRATPVSDPAAGAAAIRQGVALAAFIATFVAFAVGDALNLWVF